jgi:hypothetical protein
VRTKSTAVSPAGLALTAPISLLAWARLGTKKPWLSSSSDSSHSGRHARSTDYVNSRVSLPLFMSAVPPAHTCRAKESLHRVHGTSLSKAIHFWIAGPLPKYSLFGYLQMAMAPGDGGAARQGWLAYQSLVCRYCFMIIFVPSFLCFGAVCFYGKPA